jgi:hypothetical protein
LERINKKIHYFLEHLLVFLQTVLQDAGLNHQDVSAAVEAIFRVMLSSQERNGTHVVSCDAVTS